MIRQLPLALAASLLVASTGGAQQPERPRTTVRGGPLGAAIAVGRMDGDRLVLGLATSSGGARDTLGLLVTSITPGGPAEKAGLEEGNRLVSVNGVALRLNASDAADPEMAGVLGRRLQREIEKVKPGEAVTLGVYAGGQTRQVRITPVRADELTPASMGRARADSRSTIGASVGGFASPRDTLGVFVVAVAEDGPLAQAGIFEGSRIASINGADLRVPAADIGDDFMTNARVRRLTREIEKLEPGANAELRVYANGQYRNVTVKVVRRSDLKRDGSVSIFHSGGGGAVFTPPMGLRIDDGDRIRFEMEHLLDGDLRERIESALRGVEIDVRGLRDRWRDEAELQRRERPLLRERSGGSADTMPVEDLLKRLEQRLRESESPVRAPFRAAVATPEIDFETTVPAELRAGTLAFHAAAAPGGYRYAYGGPDLQVSPASAPQAPSGGKATFRTSGPSPQGGVFTINGIRLSPINAKLAEYLGRGSERGLLVLDISERWTGVAAGDVILAVDGKPVRDGDGIDIGIDEARDQCVELLRDGASVKVTLRRK